MNVEEFRTLFNRALIAATQPRLPLGSEAVEVGHGAVVFGGPFRPQRAGQPGNARVSVVLDDDVVAFAVKLSTAERGEVLQLLVDSLACQVVTAYPLETTNQYAIQIHGTMNIVCG